MTDKNRAGIETDYAPFICPGRRFVKSKAVFRQKKFAQT
jgi:hypothetical protein